MAERQKIAIIAAGGNSLIIDENHKSIPDQYLAAATTSRYIVDMIEQGWNVVITHGNGPQVGFIMRRSEIAINEVPPVPMDYAGADTQGAIGYMFQRAMRNEMKKRGIDRNAIAVVTQILVDRKDKAFSNPAKPIGSFMDEPTAQKHAAKHGWVVRKEEERGWRRVVASPKPIAILDIKAIETLIESNYIVIACGGGGIPVYEDSEGTIQGIEAVIDKDFASGLLAQELIADLFIITTEVEKVAINFGKKNQRWLNKISIKEAREHLKSGQFPDGSMGPKINSILKFLDSGGKAGIITNPPNLGRALKQETGTWIVSDDKL
jgi:carbamate kinase|tara:strand:+ start:570 stop:1532 length:963 start_codon:yes stop_codon:yes gene_type:complete